MAELIHWLHDYDAAREQARLSKKPILVDFSASPM
jgi:hypothetical protein